MVPPRAINAFEQLENPVVTPISTGLIHESYGLRNADGSEFILQRMNPVFSHGVNHNIRAVTEHLAARNIETLRLIPYRGEPFADLGSDGCWRLMTRITGTSFDHPSSEEHARAAGRMVASFHRALFDFEAPLLPIGFPYHDTRRHLEDLSLALRECEGHVFHAEVSALAGALLEDAAGLLSFDAVPHRVIHGDLKFNNLLFEAAVPPQVPHPVALIDLDTLARMPLAFDWGDALRSWCNRLPEDEPIADLDLSLARATTEGLMGALDTGTTTSEIESLCWGLEVVSLELCARFATDTLRECHWAWDRSRFERAGEHNRNRALGQYDLYRQARETHDERARELTG